MTYKITDYINSTLEPFLQSKRTDNRTEELAAFKDQFKSIPFVILPFLTIPIVPLCIIKPPFGMDKFFLSCAIATIPLMLGSFAIAAVNFVITESKLDQIIERDREQSKKNITSK